MATNKKQKSNKPTIKEDKARKIKASIIEWPSIDNYKINYKLSIIVILVAFAFSFAQYVQTLPFGFVLDDSIVVSENSFVKEGFKGLDDLLLTESFVGYFGEQKDLIPGARYRPLSLMTFAIEYGINGGFNTKMNHLINIILYGLCGWLVFLSLAKIFPIDRKWSFSIPFFAFVIWMVHPVHTEVVANIKGRDEIMSLIFSLICFLASFWHYEKEKFHIPSFIVILLSFILGLLSKENTLTFLAIIPASLYFFRKPNQKHMLSVFAAMMIAFVGYLILRYSAVGYFFSGKEVTDIMNNPFVGMNFVERMATVFFVLLKYIGLVFVPYPLTHDYYPFQIPRVSWLNIFVWISFILHVALAIYATINFKRRKILAYVIFFYIASLSIYSNILINVGTTMNERFLFVPTIASSVGVILFLKYFIKKFTLHELIIPSFVGLLAVVYFIISFLRVPVWESALTLNTSAAKVSTNSARANSFMATAIFNEAKDMRHGDERKTRLTEAMFYADKAIKIMPYYKNGLLMKAGIAGEFHKMNRELEPLLVNFTQVATEYPSLNFLHEYIEYIKDDYFKDPRMVNFFYNVGYEQLILKKKNYEWGLKYLNYAFDMEPNNAKILFAISQGYRFLGNIPQADLFLSKTLAIDPSYQNQ